MSSMFDRRFLIQIHNPVAFNPPVKTDASVDVSDQRTGATVGAIDEFGDLPEEAGKGPTIADLLESPEPDPKESGVGALRYRQEHKLELGAPKLRYEGFYGDDGGWQFAATFDVEHSIDEEPGTGRIEIYNLRRFDERQMLEGDVVNVWAGYRGRNLGQLIMGTITGKDRSQEGMDRRVSLEVEESGDWWPTLSAWKEPESQERASVVVKKLLEMLPLDYEYQGVGREKTYARGVSIDQRWTVMEALARLARDTRSKVYVFNGVVHFEPIGSFREREYVVTSQGPDKNLVGSLDDVSDAENSGAEQADWRVTTLLDARQIFPSAKFIVDDRRYSGWVRCIRVQYVGGEDTEFYAVADVAEADAPERPEGISEWRRTMIRGRGERPIPQ